MSNFALDIRQFVQKANGNTRRVVKQVVFLLAQEIIMRTPVDTGRARANWSFSVGTYRTTYNQDAYDQGGQSTLNRFRTNDYGPVMYITNSLPYIRGLENGFSAQAPIGMVRVSLAGLQQRIDSLVRAL